MAFTLLLWDQLTVLYACAHAHTPAHVHELGWVSPQATDRGVSSGRELRSLLLSPRPCSAITFALHTHRQMMGAVGMERLDWTDQMGENVEGRLWVLSEPHSGLTGEWLQQSQPPDSGMEPALHVSPPRGNTTGHCAWDDRTQALPG